MKKKPKPLKDSTLYTPHEIRQISVLAHVSTPTVKRVIDGGKVQPSSKARVDAAMKQIAEMGA